MTSAQEPADPRAFAQPSGPVLPHGPSPGGRVPGGSAPPGFAAPDPGQRQSGRHADQRPAAAPPPGAETREPAPFDLRAEFAALAGEPRPQVLWERIERLGAAFDQQQRRSSRAAQRPGELRSDAAAGSSGFAAQSGLSGDLGAPSEVSEADFRAAERGGAGAADAPTGSLPGNAPMPSGDGANPSGSANWGGALDLSEPDSSGAVRSGSADGANLPALPNVPGSTTPTGRAAPAPAISGGSSDLPALPNVPGSQPDGRAVPAGSASGSSDLPALPNVPGSAVAGGRAGPTAAASPEVPSELPHLPNAPGPATSGGADSVLFASSADPAELPDVSGPANPGGSPPPSGTVAASAPGSAGGPVNPVLRAGESAHAAGPAEPTTPADPAKPTGFSGGLLSGSLPAPAELAEPGAAADSAGAGRSVDVGRTADPGRPGYAGGPADAGDRPASGAHLFGAPQGRPPEAAASGRHASGPNVLGARQPPGPDPNQHQPTQRPTQRPNQHRAHPQPGGPQPVDQRVPERPNESEVTRSFPTSGEHGTVPNVALPGIPAPGGHPAALPGGARPVPFPTRGTPERPGNPPGPPSGGFLPPQAQPPGGPPQRAPRQQAPPPSAPEQTRQIPPVPQQPPHQQPVQQDQVFGQAPPFPQSQGFQQRPADPGPVTQQVPAVPQEPAEPRASGTDRPKYRPRSDGGFGPTGSSGRPDGPANQPRFARPTSWSRNPEDEESDEVELWPGDGYRPGEDESAAPQYLVEADELFDDEFGGSVLVAPPVLGAQQGAR